MSEPQSLDVSQEPEPREPRVVKMPSRNILSVAPVSVIIGAINVVIFLAMFVMSGAQSAWEPSIQTLLDWGANYGPLTASGQPWRLLTAMFLHVGLIHIFMNMWALWNVGPVTERYFGPARFLAIYLLSGLGGGCVSMFWNPLVVSAGASGAIFGILGGMLAFITLLKRINDDPQLGRIQFSIIKVIGINVLIGLSIPRIDNSAHMGGLVFGAITGVALSPLPISRSSITRGMRSLLGLAGVLVLLSATGVIAMNRVQHSPTVQRERKSDEVRDAFNAYIKSVESILKDQDAVTNEIARNMTSEYIPLEMAQDTAERARRDVDRFKALKLIPELNDIHQALTEGSVHVAAAAAAMAKFAENQKGPRPPEIEAELKAAGASTRKFKNALNDLMKTYNLRSSNDE